MMLAKDIHFGKAQILTMMQGKYKPKLNQIQDRKIAHPHIVIGPNPTTLLLARKNTCGYTKRYKPKNYGMISLLIYRFDK